MDQDHDLKPIFYSKKYYQKIVNKQIMTDEREAGFPADSEYTEVPSPEPLTEDIIIEEDPDGYTMVKESHLQEVLRKVERQETVLKHISNKLSEFTVAFNGINRVLQLLNDRTCQMEKDLKAISEINHISELHWPIRTWQQFEDMEERLSRNKIFKEHISTFFKRRTLTNDKLEDYFDASILTRFSESGRDDKIAFKDSPFLSTVIRAWDEKRTVEELSKTFNTEIVKMRNRISTSAKRKTTAPEHDSDSSGHEKKARKGNTE